MLREFLKKFNDSEANQHIIDKLYDVIHNKEYNEKIPETITFFVVNKNKNGAFQEFHEIIQNNILDFLEDKDHRKAAKAFKEDIEAAVYEHANFDSTLDFVSSNMKNHQKALAEETASHRDLQNKFREDIVNKLTERFTDLLEDAKSIDRSLLITKQKDFSIHNRN